MPDQMGDCFSCLNTRQQANFKLLQNEASIAAVSEYTSGQFQLLDVRNNGTG